MNLEQAVAHYTALARRPGWADYVREQARELAADHPVLYADLSRRLHAAIPALSVVTVQAVKETRANTYRLEPERFQLPQPVKAKGRR